jgi:methyl-accepting chemotaxis protein
MNLPFGLTTRKETTPKRIEDEQEISLLEQKLAQYQAALEDYRKCIRGYSNRLESYERNTKDNQLANVQTAMDMTYLKEQSDRTADMLENINKQVETFSNQFDGIKSELAKKTIDGLESLTASVVEANSALNGLDKNVVNRLSELLLELQKQAFYQNKQYQTELLSSMDKLAKAVKKGHTLKVILLILNIFGMGILVFLVLYVLEIIPISL